MGKRKEEKKNSGEPTILGSFEKQKQGRGKTQDASQKIPRLTVQHVAAFSSSAPFDALIKPPR
ncbi:hypothetical protein L484_014590 [Morus notabilis]|uniref:Uncharacterized protein n=1 Tax=Morus notabilis TaxID=981085 RepID=W9QYR3_9ROSA|nr:hypothetical protein L484_014590 [Morus notabilis]